MDKQTLSHYGWIIIMVLILAVMLAFATPFGKYIGRGVSNLAMSMIDANDNAMDEDNIAQMGKEWEEYLGINGVKFLSDGKVKLVDSRSLYQGATEVNGKSVPAVRNNEVFYVSTPSTYHFVDGERVSAGKDTTIKLGNNAKQYNKGLGVLAGSKNYEVDGTIDNWLTYAVPSGTTGFGAVVGMNGNNSTRAEYSPIRFEVWGGNSKNGEFTLLAFAEIVAPQTYEFKVNISNYKYIKLVHKQAETATGAGTGLECVWANAAFYESDKEWGEYLNGDTWEKKTWTGLTNFDGRYVWTDGTNIYYSNNTNQYVLNGNTWEVKTWNGLTSFNGSYIWTDGTNTYYSNGSNQYVLNGDTWEVKTWNGLTNFIGLYIWTDGTNYYYSNASYHYVLNGDTWEEKTWNGHTRFYGNYIWTDGANIYYSSYNDQYVLNGNTWEKKTWKGYTDLFGYFIWTDGTNMYYSNGSYQYVLNGNTWVEKNWNVYIKYGQNIWSDGTNIYYSYGTSQYILA